MKIYANACRHSSIEIDMRETKWIDASMCAPFGALIEKLKKRDIEVKLVNPQDDVKSLLRKNTFLSCYNCGGEADTYETTIPYRRFDVGQYFAFARYIVEKLTNHQGLSKMSKTLHKAIRRGVDEVFNNAANHSKTGKIICCGQYFPKNDRLNFAVADFGVGILQTIKDYMQRLNEDYTGDDLSAIDWATNGNSTKSDGMPGGMGLRTLCRFLDVNEGAVRIVSGTGYWRKGRRAEMKKKELPYPFPGTVVDLEINTSDAQSVLFDQEETLNKVLRGGANVKCG